MKSRSVPQLIMAKARLLFWLDDIYNLALLYQVAVSTYRDRWDLRELLSESLIVEDRYKEAAELFETKDTQHYTGTNRSGLSDEMLVFLRNMIY